jgi:hypothetical protein
MLLRCCSACVRLWAAVRRGPKGNTSLRLYEIPVKVTPIKAHCEVPPGGESHLQTKMCCMKKRRRPGRRKGAAAERWPREEGGAAYRCGKAKGGGEVRRITCRRMERLYRAGSSGRRMPQTPVPKDEAEALC